MSTNPQTAPQPQAAAAAAAVVLRAPLIDGAGPDVIQATVAQAAGMTALTSDTAPNRLRHDPSAFIFYGDTQDPQQFPKSTQVGASPIVGEGPPVLPSQVM